jgi:hypothetical protein
LFKHKKADAGQTLLNVKALVEKYPDFVYHPCQTGTCGNTTGGNPNYPELSGCIIGQAAAAAGAEFDDVNEFWSAPAVVDGPIELVDVLRKIQNRQDVQCSWKDAWDITMEEVNESPRLSEYVKDFLSENNA